MPEVHNRSPRRNNAKKRMDVDENGNTESPLINAQDNTAILFIDSCLTPKQEPPVGSVESLEHWEKTSRSASQKSHWPALREKLKARLLPLIKGVGPYVVTIFICTLIAGVSRGLASVEEFEADSRHSSPANSCLHTQTSYNAHLFYAISLSSTMGFGVLHPCSTWLKVMTVIASLIGLPAFLYVLVDSGDRLASLCHRIQVRHRTNPINLTNLVMFPVFTRSAAEGPKPADAENVEDEDLKPWIGLLILSLCFLGIANYYIFFENYRVVDSVYYTLMLYLGGDFSLERFNYSVPLFVLVFVGFAMVSMTINIIMDNIQRMIRRVKKDVQRQIEEAQEKGLPIPPMEEMMKNALEKAGANGMAGKLISNNRMSEVKEFAKAEVNHVEEVAKVKQEAQELVKQVQSDAAETKLEKELSDSATDTNDLTFSTDVGVATECPVVVHSSGQTQVLPNYDNSTQCSVATTSEVDTITDPEKEIFTESHETQTEKSESNVGAQICPVTRSVKVQIPSAASKGSVGSSKR